MYFNDGGDNFMKKNGLYVLGSLVFVLLIGITGSALAQDRRAEPAPVTVAYLNTETGVVTRNLLAGSKSIPLTMELLQGLRTDSGDLGAKAGVNGASVVDLHGRFQHVMVGSVGADGKVTVGHAGASAGAHELGEFLQAEQEARVGDQ